MEFEIPLRNLQIQEMCQELGFKVVSHSGYPKVKCNQQLLDRCCLESFTEVIAYFMAHLSQEFPPALLAPHTNIS